MDTAEWAFGWLARGPRPLSVDGAAIGFGLPRRVIPIDELASILVHPSTRCRTRDAVWRLLAHRARSEGGQWTVAAVGCALRDLRRTARRLRGDWDTQADLLSEFLTALHQIDLGPAKVFYRLMDAAQVRTRANLRRGAAEESGVPGPGATSVPPPRPGGHPDFVLARAVKRGMITAAEADLIGAVRLEGVTRVEYAQRIGASWSTVRKTLNAAEARLVAAIRSGELADPDAEVVYEATLAAVQEPKQRRHRP